MRGIAAVVALSALGLSGVAHAATLRVPSQYPTVALALSAANDFDNIAVNTQTYVPETAPLSINRSVTIQADGTGRVILPPMNVGNNVFFQLRGAEVRAANTSPASLALTDNALVNGSILGLSFSDVLFTAPASAEVRAVSVTGAGSVVVDGFAASGFESDAVFYVPLGTLRLENGTLVGNTTDVAPVIVGSQDAFLESVVFDGNEGGEASAIFLDGPTGLVSVQGSSFLNGRSAGGGALTVSDTAFGASLTVTSCAFDGNDSESHAADVWVAVSDAVVELTDDSFSSSSGIDGAAITSWSSLTMQRLDFVGPMQSDEGGTVRLLGGDSVATDMSWDSLGVLDEGGAVCVSGGTLVGADWSVVDARARVGGLLWTSVPVSLSNVYAEDLRATEGGVFYLAPGGSLTGSGYEVNGAQAYGSGAVMFLEADTHASLSSLTLTELTAGGGALAQSSGADLDISGLTVTGWTVSGNGGLVNATDGAVTLSGVTLQDGGSTGNGGVLYGDGADVIVDGLDVLNTSVGRSGLFYLNEGSLDLTDVALTDVSANAGGLVYGVNMDLTLEGAAFGESIARVDGGALWLSGGTADISGIEASAMSVSGRGGFLAAYGTDVTITDSRFANMAAATGAVLYAEDGGSISIQRVRGCSGAAGSGSFLYADGTNNLLLENSILQDNDDTSGGAVQIVSDVGDAVTLRNNSLVGATSPQGLVSGSFSSLQLVNNLFAQADYAVFFGAAATGAVSGAYNLWFDNDNSTNAAGSAFFPEPTALYADPLLGARTIGLCHAQLYLDQNSPARNGGDPGIDNPDGSRSDIGAWGGPGALLPDADSDGWSVDIDCDDTNDAVHPFAPDAWGDGLDSDCRGNDDWDRDADGYVRNMDVGLSSLPGGDCNDGDPLTRPGAADAWYDGLDRNCDGADDFDADADGYVGDVYADRSPLPAGDCNDAEPTRNPGEFDVWYDGFDADCDGADDYDQDGDGYVPAAYDLLTLLPGGDCDDLVASVNPGASDAWYDGLDADCDEINDYDQDGDGFVVNAYAAASGLPGGDCDDTNAQRRPGVGDAWYDGLDANCDGANDYDQDGDGVVPDQWAAVAGRPGGDCDDTRATVKPGATDTAYDGRDSNCDGSNDYDQDGDGYTLTRYTDESGLPGGDCDDEDAEARPNRRDTWYDGVDANCDGLNDYDRDADGFVPAQYAEEAGLPGDDCDDEDAEVSPDAPDAPYDGVDDNCDGAAEFDLDNDGRVLTGQGLVSGKPEGDCNDRNAQIYSGAVESWYDGVDANCDNRDDYDQDGDGYVPAAYDALSPLPGGDCNDAATVGLTQRPGMADAWYDGVDSDCDGTNDYDQDGDGFAPTAFSGPSGLPGGDCDDTAGDIRPGATEQWYDGIDQDCGGDNDWDQDGDGFPAGGGTPAPPVVDCNDGDTTIRPGATPKSCSVADCDCSGGDDWDGDGDGYAAVADADELYPGELPLGDCDDADDGRNPGVVDLPDDGVDQDCSGSDVQTWVKGGLGCASTGASPVGLLALSALALVRRRRTS